jgi:hypothetical protein
MYDLGQVFRENEDAEVDRFTIIGINGSTYTIAEYWSPPDKTARWESYNIGKSTLVKRRMSGEVEPIGQATDDELDALDAFIGASPDDYDFIEDVYDWPEA